MVDSSSTMEGTQTPPHQPDDDINIITEHKDNNLTSDEEEGEGLAAIITDNTNNTKEYYSTFLSEIINILTIFRGTIREDMFTLKLFWPFSSGGFLDTNTTPFVNIGVGWAIMVLSGFNCVYKNINLQKPNKIIKINIV